jgi:NitT/TauT family transport system ATP-binding protein
MEQNMQTIPIDERRARDVHGNAKPEALRESLLYLRDVEKSYGDKRVLDNVDLAVRAGEICSVVGPSGCGKSTLLKLILGHERPTKGEVLISGNPVGYPDPSRGIVFQKYSLYPHLSVLDNVLLGKKFTMGMWRWTKERKHAREEAMAYLSEVRLADNANKFPHELSGGMQQRAAIAQALIVRPQILLMDEPFGALDPEVRERLQVFLLEMWEKYKMTIFFVTHDLEEAIFVGTRVVLLSQHYIDDRGDAPEVRRGAKVICDYPLAQQALSTKVKKTAEFGELIEMLRGQFKPAKRHHVREFDLRHSDSFQTLRPEENRGG